jgi:hypothetical protein
MFANDNGNQKTWRVNKFNKNIRKLILVKHQSIRLVITLKISPEMNILYKESMQQ